MFEHFKDSINPRGAEYGATARAAAAAQRNAETAEDLLELQLATSDTEREFIAARIRSRRQAQVRRRAWWESLELLATALLVGGIAWYMLTPTNEAPQSAVTQHTQAGASIGADDTPAPAIRARADDTQGSDDPAAAVSRGEQILHDAGFSDKQIHDARNP